MEYTDNEIRQWARIAWKRGGAFLHGIGQALLYADDDNFALLRDAATKLVEKYPKYLDWAKENTLTG